MIITILPSSANFHAVAYNEHKVAKGDAVLLEMTNIHGIQGFGSYTPQELQNYFLEYSSRNDRIQKAQFHVAISCKGHENTPEQLRQLAHEYLKRMGYGEEGQPLVIYAHYDTDNTHIHIVTSRIAPDGHKIDHNHERRKSQRILDEIMGINPQREMECAISNAKEYAFSTVGQFAAVMTASGYDYKIHESNDSIVFFRNGVEVGKISHSAIAELAHENMLKIQHDAKATSSERNKRQKQLKAMLKKSHDNFSDRQQYANYLKKKYGISLVFHGSDDSPFGYTLVDNSRKLVFAGKEIMPIKQLLDFPTKEEIAERKAEHPQRPNKSVVELSPTVTSEVAGSQKTGRGITPPEHQQSTAPGRANVAFGADGGPGANREWEVDAANMDDQDKQIKR